MSLLRDRIAAGWISAALLGFVAAPISQAAETSTVQTKSVSTKETSLQRIQKMAARINTEASTPEGEEAVVARLSKQLAVSPDTLRAQQQAWGIGYGDLSMVYGFSRASRTKATPTQVVEMRFSGKEWDVIGKELGVKVDNVASKMKKNVGPKPPPATPK